MKFLKFILLVCFIFKTIPFCHATGAEYEFKEVAAEADNKRPEFVQQIGAATKRIGNIPAKLTSMETSAAPEFTTSSVDDGGYKKISKFFSQVWQKLTTKKVEVEAEREVKEAPAAQGEAVYNRALSLLAQFPSIKHMSADDKPILSKALAALPQGEHENVCRDISRHFTKSSRLSVLDGEHENTRKDERWFAAKRNELRFLDGLIRLAAHVPADQREDIYSFVGTFTKNMSIEPQMAVIETLTKVVRAGECKEVCDSVRILLSRFMGFFAKPPVDNYELVTYIEIVAIGMPAGQREDMCNRAQRCFTGKEDLSNTDEGNFEDHLMDFLKTPL